MKKQFLLACAIQAIAVQIFAQTISQVRSSALNTTVTIRGVVTNGSELGSLRYVQDATAGISMYGSNLSSVNRGDSVVATGTLTSYNNLLEITPVTSFSVLATGRPLPTPFVITPSQMIETYEAELVKFNNCTFPSGGNNFASNTNYNFISSTQTGVLRISSTSPLVGTIIPNQNVNLVGVASQFCSSPNPGCTTGYQLILRDQNDIVNTSTIWMTSQPIPTNIITTGLTVNWATNIAGTYYIKYGKTPNLELGIVNGAGTSATPGVNITGATPATIYYAQVFSVNGSDTAKSSVKVFCTQSLSTGTIKSYFVRTVDTTVSSGTNAIQNTALADTLAQYINRAKNTMDIAIYNWDNSSGGTLITNAVNAAYVRGVKIRIVFDGSTAQSGLQTLNAAIKNVASPQGASYTIMHNKFVIIDANSSPNDAIVWTGSMNWTSQQMTTDANNVIIFQDQSLARGYKLEFDEMWGDSSVTSNPNSANAKFGQFKTDNTPHEYEVGGKRVESYFSPSDGTTTHILSTISTANTDMYFWRIAYYPFRYCK
ncbi:MAG: hypothetical protein HY841_04885 [Bacteroidetes bacterium]|nr:hypothetical protein [Bacteroidota bacterium]